MTKFMSFLKDEEGAITIEWVALAAGVVILAIGVVIAIQGSLQTSATAIGAGVESRVNSTIAG